jgi:2-polyprenyl-3-methyl-5-hydroxy-6-metoxy-1,4-benzoquinol methylase
MHEVGRPQHKCCVCNAVKSSYWFTKQSILRDGKSYQIFRCSQCGSAFVNPKPSTEYLEQYYNSAAQSHAVGVTSLNAGEGLRKVLHDEETFPNSVIDAARIARYCRYFTRATSFLDIGPGYGFFSRAAISQGFQVTAVEPSSECRRIFKEMNGFEPLSGMLTAEFVKDNGGAFDVVLMSQVLEHISELDSMVSMISAVLRRDDGTAVIAVPHFRSWLSKIQGKADMFISPPEHLNFFSVKGLINLFGRHGFTCSKMHTISRINERRVLQRIPMSPLIGRPVTVLASSLLRVSDYFGGGMFINAYFRKGQ